MELREAWLPYALTEHLDDVLTPGTRVFEFGGGGSTAWFADRKAQVVTVEHDQQWFESLSQALRGLENVELLYRSPSHNYSQYVTAIDAYPDRFFDIVVVDGRERVRCFEHAISKVKPGGLMLLDDADRRRYRPAFDLVTWPRDIVHGFAPSKPTMAHTAVFTRPYA